MCSSRVATCRAVLASVGFNVEGRRLLSIPAGGLRAPSSFFSVRADAECSRCLCRWSRLLDLTTGLRGLSTAVERASSLLPGVADSSSGGLLRDAAMPGCWVPGLRLLLGDHVRRTGIVISCSSSCTNEALPLSTTTVQHAAVSIALQPKS